MQGLELEGLAEWAYRVAGIADDIPAPGLELAQRLLNTDAPVSLCDDGTDARLVKASIGWRIRVRATSSPIEARWLVAHELAEWLLEREGYCKANVESVADSLAARLVAPRRAVRAALRCGLSIGDLASAFCATQSCMLLRKAEVSDTPTALVTPARIYWRGSKLQWRSAPSVSRVPITDARCRVGLVAL